MEKLQEILGLIVGGMIASFIAFISMILMLLIISLPILVILLVLSPLWGPFAIVLYFIFKS